MPSFLTPVQTREFKMLAGLSLDDNNKSNQDKYEKFIDDIRDFFSLNLVVSKDVSSGFHEYFYIHNEGGDIYEGQKAVSIAMFYEYARNQKICSKYRNKHNKMIQPLLITFGLGIQRLFFAILDTVRDDLGFRFPKSIRPFNIMVCPSTDANLGMANNVFLHISSLYSDILYDDRVQITIYEKCKLSDFLGIPIKILVTNEAIVLETRENPNFKQSLRIDDVFNTNILITTINKLLKD